MRPIIYDVAMTLDGFICHEDGSADGFVAEGEHVSDYLERLKQYTTVLMGRKTYEFGYNYGLKPGERAYPHMEHFIFSRTLRLDSDQLHVVHTDCIDVVRELKSTDGAPIYLCGGGILAATLLDHGLIDQWVIKLNPVVFGKGIKTFGPSTKRIGLDLLEVKQYDSGVALLRYDLRYDD